MLAHRFRDLLDVPIAAPAVMTAAFVPCPVFSFGTSAVHQAQLAYLYRLAFEQAQAQVADARANHWPAFSLN